jgi:bacteriocin-like protein
MNSYFDFFEKVNVLNQHIRRGYTGTPDDLAKRLSVSRGTLYKIINGLKSRGVEIEYCRNRCTFFYNNDVVVDIRIEIKGLTDMNDDELKNISGGSKLFSFRSFFYTEML